MAGHCLPENRCPPVSYAATCRTYSDRLRLVSPRVGPGELREVKDPIPATRNVAAHRSFLQRQVPASAARGRGSPHISQERHRHPGLCSCLARRGIPWIWQARHTQSVPGAVQSGSGSIRLLRACVDCGILVAGVRKVVLDHFRGRGGIELR